MKRDDGVPSLTRRIAASLAFGFLSVFAFAILAQAAVDFLNTLGVQMKFLLPFGLLGAFHARDVLMNVVSGLAVVSLIVSLLFFLLIQRQDNLAKRRFWRDEGD